MKKIIFTVFCLLIIQGLAYAQKPADYLILQSISNFSSEGKGKCDDGSGIVGSADHFDADHNVTTCVTDYYNFQQKMAVEIKIEQHAGADSDKWLLHEIEDSLRDGEMETLGLLTSGVRLREINGNQIISLRGSVYRWIRNNVVVNISYTDLRGIKPEPLEVIQAYLAKFPSTITMTPTDFKGNAHNVQWIKDEMERRLWLCDKWSMQLQLGKVSQEEMLKNLVENMTIFLNYRKKYYGVSAEKELEALGKYLRANDGTSIKAKLTEYKTWWAQHKEKRISLP
jgi:hypothetical protein